MQKPTANIYVDVSRLSLDVFEIFSIIYRHKNEINNFFYQKYTTVIHM
jgi:hypothetical protein